MTMDSHDELRPTPRGARAPKRTPKPLPRIEDVMKKPYFIIGDIAALMQTTVYVARTMQKGATIPAPVGKRGRRWYWRRDVSSASAGFVSFAVILALLFRGVQFLNENHLKRHQEGRCGGSWSCSHCNPRHYR